jgi:arsenite oxidase small subunit
VTRRDFFKILVGAGVASMAVAAASSLRYFSFIPQPSTPGGTPETQLVWPRVKVVNISSLQELKAWTFNYPLVDTPNLLVKLGTTAPNGVGPNGDVVAYSMICQHLGVLFGFYPTGALPPCYNAPRALVHEGYCCAHGGHYDFTDGARVIGGPPPRPVPPVKLEYDDATGDVFAVAMGDPSIYGKGTPGTTGSQVLQVDLQGGEIVTQDTVNAKEL